MRLQNRWIVVVNLIREEMGKTANVGWAAARMFEGFIAAFE